jgi:hypothetical protein
MLSLDNLGLWHRAGWAGLTNWLLLDSTADIGNSLAWAISCSAALSLRLICSGVWRIHLMAMSPAQSGQLKTVIHPGAIPGATPAPLRGAPPTLLKPLPR